MSARGGYFARLDAPPGNDIELSSGIICHPGKYHQAARPPVRISDVITLSQSGGTFSRHFDGPYSENTAELDIHGRVK
jgi:hypothetical protein